MKLKFVTKGYLPEGISMAVPLIAVARTKTSSSHTTVGSSCRSNMELDLQRRLLPTAVLYSLAEAPQLPPLPLAFGFIYEHAIGQQR
jgi:hypothetical protein